MDCATCLDVSVAKRITKSDRIRPGSLHARDGLCSRRPGAGTRAEAAVRAEENRSVAGSVSRAFAAICSRSDARRKTDEVEVVAPQHGGGADDGPADFGPSKA